MRRGEPSFDGLAGIEIFRSDRLADAIGAVKPSPKVDHLAPVAAEWPKRGVLGALRLEGITASWTLELRHASSRAPHDDESFFLLGFASFFDVVDAAFVSEVLVFSALSDLSDFFSVAFFSALTPSL